MKLINICVKCGKKLAVVLDYCQFCFEEMVIDVNPLLEEKKKLNKKKNEDRTN